MMKRKHVVATVCILLVWAAIIVLVRRSSTTPPASGPRVVTQDGAITVVPRENQWKVTVTANLPPTNNPTAKPDPKDSKP
jgi:hypothetical protein